MGCIRAGRLGTKSQSSYIYGHKVCSLINELQISAYGVFADVFSKVKLASENYRHSP
jgi:hypothetical protein